MKILFLETDGILNNGQNDNKIRYDCVKSIKKIVDETNSNVVIVSKINNRLPGTPKEHLDKYLRVFYSEHIRVMGIIPYRLDKEDKIKQYIYECGTVEKYCIIDTEDFEDQNMNVVKVTPSKNKILFGLDKNSINTTIEILGKKHIVKTKRKSLFI